MLCRVVMDVFTTKYKYCATTTMPTVDGKGH